MQPKHSRDGRATFSTRATAYFHENRERNVAQAARLCIFGAGTLISALNRTRPGAFGAHIDLLMGVPCDPMSRRPAVCAGASFGCGVWTRVRFSCRWVPVCSRWGIGGILREYLEFPGEGSVRRVSSGSGRGRQVCAESDILHKHPY